MELPIRILVVEDFAPFRQFVCATLRTNPRFQILADVSDGPEAVQQAEELKPDLILLDIGLPTMNGIEVARRVREIAPESKIIFVTQESDAEVVQDVLIGGAWGYVLKMYAARELLVAVEAVCQGRKFVSAQPSLPLASHSVSGSRADRKGITIGINQRPG